MKSLPHSNLIVRYPARHNGRDGNGQQAVAEAGWSTVPGLAPSPVPSILVNTLLAIASLAPATVSRLATVSLAEVVTV